MTITREELIVFCQSQIEEGDACQAEGMLDRLRDGEPIEPESAKEFLRANYEKGCRCPACDQHVKLYKRGLNAGMARALILISRGPKIDANGWVDIKSIDVRGGDYAKLRYWELIEQRPNEDQKKKDSGIWRVTQKGLKFISDQIRVPSHAHVYNDRVRGWSDNDVNIRQVLGKAFDYSQLMSS
jgi:hypothetical protein